MKGPKASMIRKLKIKLILLTMTSVLLLLTVLVIGMNVVNFSSIVRHADKTLNTLAETPIPPPEQSKPFPYEKPPFDDQSDTHFFSVLLDEQGNVLHSDVSHVGAVGEQAADFASEVHKKNGARGFVGTFRYLRIKEGTGTRVIFLDCKNRLESFDLFLKVSVGSAAVGFLLVLLVFTFFSSRIIRPIAESYEKQKRFITDAGHEIKTPLTIIGANVDILEMETGYNESLSDIRHQTKRLTTLTNDLVYLARMEESEQSVPMVEFPVSDTVRETAEPFRVLAQASEKTWVCDILPMLTLKGNDNAIRQLVSVLLDNALKYSPQGGTIALRLFSQGRTVVLTVFNTTASPVGQETLDRVFDRFYRTDPSRNSETGGHGIGLSIAKAIVHAHGGKIVAASEDAHTFRITVTIPM